MKDLVLADGKASMSRQTFSELENKGMIVYSGEQPMFLYRGYAHQIIFID